MVCCSRNKQIAIANSQLDHGIFLPLLEQAFDPEERQTASRRHKSSKEQIVEVPLIMSHPAFRKTEHKGFEGDKIRRSVTKHPSIDCKFYCPNQRNVIKSMKNTKL